MIYPVAMALLVVLSRWAHVISACLVIGGVFFARFILPSGLRMLDENSVKQATAKWRRSFKMMIHTVILLLIVTGIYNTMAAWDKYKLDEAVLHSLWGTHVLLAALAIGISLYALAGKEERPAHRRMMALNFVILLLVVAASSTLKWARERAIAQHSTQILAGQ